MDELKPVGVVEAEVSCSEITGNDYKTGRMIAIFDDLAEGTKLYTQPAVPSLTDAEIDAIGLSSHIEAFQNKEFRMRRNQNMTHSERADYDAEIDFVRRIEKKVRGEV